MKKTIILLVGLLLLISACKVENKATEVTVNEDHKYCESDDDCTSVQTKCNGCECLGKAINKEYLEEYQLKYAEMCEGYNGPVCDLMCALAYVKCVDNKCSIVQDDVTEDMLDTCEVDDECMVASYSHCCGATKRAINQEYLGNYNNHPEWQRYDGDDCALMGICRDDSEVTEASCEEGRCSLVFN